MFKISFEKNSKRVNMGALSLKARMMKFAVIILLVSVFVVEFFSLSLAQTSFMGIFRATFAEPTGVRVRLFHGAQLLAENADGAMHFGTLEFDSASSLYFPSQQSCPPGSADGCFHLMITMIKEAPAGSDGTIDKGLMGRMSVSFQYWDILNPNFGNAPWGQFRHGIGRKMNAKFFRKTTVGPASTTMLDPYYTNDKQVTLLDDLNGASFILDAPGPGNGLTSDEMKIIFSINTLNSATETYIKPGGTASQAEGFENIDHPGKYTGEVWVTATVL